MRLTLGQLREMVEQVAGTGSGWVPAAKDIDPRMQFSIDGKDEAGEDMVWVTFRVWGPKSWPGPLSVSVWTDYLEGGSMGGAVPDENSIDMWWENVKPWRTADWDELGIASFQALADAVMQSNFHRLRHQWLSKRKGPATP